LMLEGIAWMAFSN